MAEISFKRHRFPPEIIKHAIWLYARFTLSFRDVEDLMAERGIDVSKETLRRWFLKFGRLITGNLRQSRPRPGSYWHLDEMVVAIRGHKYLLWRAVDQEGEVLDFLVQRRRCAKSAERLLRKLLKKQGYAPSRISTDKLKSYPAAIREFRLSAVHDQGLRANNLQKIHTSLCDGANANISGSSHLDQRNDSCQYTLPSTTLSTSNAIFSNVASLNSFELTPSLYGTRVGSQLDQDGDGFSSPAAVNVSVPPWSEAGHASGRSSVKGSTNAG